MCIFHPVRTDQTEVAQAVCVEALRPGHDLVRSSEQKCFCGFYIARRRCTCMYSPQTTRLGIIRAITAGEMFDYTTYHIACEADAQTVWSTADQRPRCSTLVASSQLYRVTLWGYSCATCNETLRNRRVRRTDGGANSGKMTSTLLL